jgi:hypothetical protein
MKKYFRGQRSGLQLPEIDSMSIVHPRLAFRFSQNGNQPRLRIGISCLTG